ncbi:MAG: acyl carrier protein [Planctomycetaceae bacterium]|nr:MAG: acyl carrier protein [Planctomycetaceae bacterium]
MLTGGCGVSRDDTTAATRQIIADQLGFAYDAVKPTTTLGELGCDELDLVEIIMSLEEQFEIYIPDAELDALSGQAGWSGITVLELANLARSKR